MTLPALKAAVRHARNSRREPGGHHRRLLDDAPSDPAGLPAPNASRPASAGGYGQAHVPDWLLIAATLTLAISFATSDNLAAAYEIAVSADMMTSLLLSIAIRDIWGWPLPAESGIRVGFGAMEGAFLSANLFKFTQGAGVARHRAHRLYANLADGFKSMRRNSDSGPKATGFLVSYPQ
jgi:KUP system potassium uptake protein